MYEKDGILLPLEEHIQNVYEIGSLTKTFTALLIAKAESDGKLSLDDRIDRFLDMPSPADGRAYPKIRNILSHTSGYKPYYLEKGMAQNHLLGRNDFYGITKKQILERASKITFEKESDFPFEYSNFGYAVLGLVLESACQKSYTELVNDFAQNELGLAHTRIADGTGNLFGYWDWRAEDGYIPAGALYSTIGDMILYAQLLLEGEGIFSSCREMFFEIGPSKEKSRNEKLGIHADRIGRAWICDEADGFFWHNGGTGRFNCYLAFSPADKKAVVVLSDTAPSFRIPATLIGTKMMGEQEVMKTSESLIPAFP